MPQDRPNGTVRIGGEVISPIRVIRSTPVKPAINMTERPASETDKSEDAWVDLVVERIAEFVARTVSTAPPPTSDQRDRLTAILREVTP